MHTSLWTGCFMIGGLKESTFCLFDLLPLYLNFDTSNQTIGPFHSFNHLSQMSYVPWKCVLLDNVIHFEVVPSNVQVFPAGIPFSWPTFSQCTHPLSQMAASDRRWWFGVKSSSDVGSLIPSAFNEQQFTTAMASWNDVLREGRPGHWMIVTFSTLHLKYLKWTCAVYLSGRLPVPW